jgi:hypothetical protein
MASTNGEASAFAAIRQLKYRYFRLLDTKDWSGLEQCFALEATASYPQRECADRDEIMRFLTESMTPDLITMHHGHHPEITVDGTTATGIWYLHDKVFAPAFDFALEGAALYRDTYECVDGEWLITHTGYQRIFESTWSTKDAPGWQIKQGRDLSWTLS